VSEKKNKTALHNGKFAELETLCGEGSGAKTYTYFVLNESSGDIKIGKTTNIKGRMSGLQNGSAQKLCLLHLVNEDREAEFHRRFAHIRIPGGEWFQGTPILRNFVDALKEGVDSAIAGKPTVRRIPKIRAHHFSELKVVRLGISPLLFERACARAKNRGVSVNDMIATALESYLRKK
jgi:hypothetical protein